MRFFACLALAAITPCLMGQAIGARPDDRSYANGIAAVVNERIITVEELRRELVPLLEQLSRSATSPEDMEKRLAEMRADVLRNMIDRILIIKDFTDRGAMVPKMVIEAELENIITTQFQGDRQQFLDYLKAEGKTIRDFRKEIEENQILQYMRGQQRRTLAEISPERIQQFYEQHKQEFFQKEAVHLRQITIQPLPGEALEQTRKRGAQAYAELQKGKPFEQVAAEFSQDAKAKDGGDWGWVTRENIRKELSDSAFELKPGGYTQPIDISNYTFILYVQDYRPEGVQPLDEVRDRVELAINAENARKAQQKWMERLRRDAYIKTYL